MSSTTGSPASTAPDGVESQARDLDQLLLDAHAADDRTRLAGLYAQAADLSEGRGDIDAACFFLTQAFVFALDEGLPVCRELQLRLYRHGREERP